MPPTKTAAPAKPAPAKATPTKTPAAAAPAEEAPAKAPRQKLSDLPQEQKDEKAQELIRSLYNLDTTDESMREKRKIRSRLRNLDPKWTETYAEFISTEFPPASDEAEAAEAPAAAPAKKPIVKK